MNVRYLGTLGVLLLIGVGCQPATPPPQTSLNAVPRRPLMAADDADWRSAMPDRLPYLGRGNWIVVADSSFPLLSCDGIDTLSSESDQVEAVRWLLALMDESRHVRPIIYTDSELNAVAESDAPGIDDYRNKLKGAVGDRPVQTLTQEELINRIIEESKTNRIIVLKTGLALPYTAVFIRLDTRYWNVDAEQRMREAMGGNGNK